MTEPSGAQQTQLHEGAWSGEGWKLLDEFNSQPTRLKFTMANMLEYFIHCKATNGNPTNYFKDINTKAYPLFKAGHVQYVHFKVIGKMILMKCTCMPEMRKDITYTLRVVFSSTTSDIKFAICGCPAGHGPQCTCKHLACFCYFIEEFCRHGTINYT